jgi:hypothetical protein
VVACEAERVIFVGGSVGGFAALYYSWLLPGSIVIAANPQTDLERYFVLNTNRYRRYCRPSMSKDDRLSSVITSSLVSCYAERFDNSVIYLQNAADPPYVRDHFAPFLAAIDLPHQKRLVARLGYWGRGGHKQPPAREWLAWLNAAIVSPSGEAEDIQRTHWKTVSQGLESPKPLADDQDYRLAAAIVEQAHALEGATDSPSLHRSTP